MLAEQMIEGFSNIKTTRLAAMATLRCETGN